MSDEPVVPVLVGGRYITFSKPTSGQLEMLARIQRSLARGTDDSKTDFWAKQMDRLGTLMESLMGPEDSDIVEQMMLRGEIDTSDILTAFFEGMQPTEASPAVVAADPKPAASPKRVRRS